VIANSLISHDLQGQAAGAGYNQRVVECRLATAVLGKRLQLAGWQEYRKLYQIQEALEPSPDEWWSCSCECSDRMIAILATMADIVRANLQRAPYTIDSIARELGLSEQQVVDTYCVELLAADGSRTVPATHEFRLYQRALHVFTEVTRVWQFAALCCGATNDTSEVEQRLGELMNQSHQSCRELFECSCAEVCVGYCREVTHAERERVISIANERCHCIQLDAVVEAARSLGACGARLTGAGWGGWVVALVPSSIDANTFVESLQQTFYRPRLERSGDTQQSADELGRLLDATTMAFAPGAGAYTCSGFQ
jgi:N-acetylgalactosamine kinase